MTTADGSDGSDGTTEDGAATEAPGPPAQPAPFVSHDRDHEGRLTRALDNSYHEFIEQGVAELPDEEAGQAARDAGAMAVAADDDRQAVIADAAKGGVSDQDLAEIKRLADDAIDNSLRVTQDAVDAHTGRKDASYSQAQAGEDGAQDAQSKVAHDLAQADAIRARVEGHPVDDTSDLPSDHT